MIGQTISHYKILERLVQVAWEKSILPRTQVLWTVESLSSSSAARGIRI